MGPHDVVAGIEATDVDGLARLIDNEISAVDGVVRMDTCLIVAGQR
jgi:hypothetical protein